MQKCANVIRHNSRPTVVDASEKSVLNYAIEQNATRCVRAFIDTDHPKLIDLRTVNQPPPLILSAVKGTRHMYCAHEERRGQRSV